MSRRGFTLIEVLAIVLVLTIGMFSGVTVLRYGVALARDAQASALALPTATTVLRDLKPLGIPTSDFVPAGAGTWEGHVNGMWVRRRVFDQVVTGGQTFATVQVEVFWSADSSRILSLSERISFRAP